MSTGDDLGYFGPDSVSWQVHKEVTVLFGGARAVLTCRPRTPGDSRSAGNRLLRAEPLEAS